MASPADQSPARGPGRLGPPLVAQRAPGVHPGEGGDRPLRGRAPAASVGFVKLQLGDAGRRSVALLRAARQGITEPDRCGCPRRSATWRTGTWRCSLPPRVVRSTSCRGPTTRCHGCARRRSFGAARSAHRRVRSVHRLDPDQLVAAGDLVCAARPDLASVTEGLVGVLLSTADARSERPAARRPPPQERAGARRRDQPRRPRPGRVPDRPRPSSAACWPACGARGRGDEITDDTAAAAADAFLASVRPQAPRHRDLLWYAAAALAGRAGSTRGPPGRRRTLSVPGAGARDGAPLGRGPGGRTGDDATAAAVLLPALGGARAPGALDAPGRRPGRGLRRHAPERRPVARGAPAARLASRSCTCPQLGLDADYALVSRDERFTVEEAVRLRRAMILEAYRGTAPDVLLIELCPFGRKKFAPELMPLLEAAHADRPDHPAWPAASATSWSAAGATSRGTTTGQVGSRTSTSTRCSSTPTPASRPSRRRSTPPTRCARPVHYTGFVRGAPHAAAAAGSASARVLVSAGGGMVGAPLFRAAVEAPPAPARRPRAAHGDRDRPVPPRARSSTSSPACAAGTAGLDVVRYVPDLAAEMAASAVSVSQVGYNTTMDILGCATPAVVVPYGEGREDEQAERARRLERLGAVRVIDPDRLSAQTRSPTPYATPWTGRRWPSLSTSTDAPGPRSC